MIELPTLVGCSLFVLKLDDKGEIHTLMFKRKGSHGHGQMAIPGGKVAGGESITEAMSRECAEEVGLTIHPSTIRIGPMTMDHFPEQKKYFLNVWGSTWMPKNQAPRIGEPDKLEDLQWVPLSVVFYRMRSRLFDPFKGLFSSGEFPPYRNQELPSCDKLDWDKVWP